MDDLKKLNEQQTPNTNKKMSSTSTDASNEQPAEGKSSPASDKKKGEREDGSKSPSADAPHHPIAEFLYQLTKMLQDDNDDVIEWTQGRIKVHSPERLESDVLHRYFRHSKFASFQRQLNYFGFRKIAGKGKMAPCSYVNEACTEDIRSLLHIKRKTNGSAARKAAMNRAIAAERLQAAAAAGNFAALGATLPPHLRPEMAEMLGQALGTSGPAWLGQQLQAQAARDQALAAFAAGQKRQSASDFARFGLNPAALGALEQLQQLGALQAAAGAAPNQAAAAAALGLPAAPAAAAPAAAGAGPATAAMNAAAANGKGNANLFEGNPNLKSLVNEQAQGKAPAAAGANAAAAGTANQNLMNRLPSSGTIFPDSLSAASLSHLLPGAAGAAAPGAAAAAGAAGNANRLNSMISLSSYLSREPSLVDLLLANGGAAAAAGGAAGQFNPALAAAAAGMNPPAAPADGSRKSVGGTPL